MYLPLNSLTVQVVRLSHFSQESDHVAEIQTASKTLSEKLSTATTDEEVSKLLEEYEDSMAVLEARQDLERRKQREDLKKKLAMRRNKKSGGDKVSVQMYVTCIYVCESVYTVYKYMQHTHRTKKSLSALVSIEAPWLSQRRLHRSAQKEHKQVKREECKWRKKYSH